LHCDIEVYFGLTLRGNVQKHYQSKL